MTDTSESSIAALNREAERRRKEAADKAQKPLPGHVLAIRDSLVRYTMEPSLLPFSLVDGPKLRNSLFQRYRLRFRPPTLDVANLQKLGLNAGKLTDDALFDYQLARESPELIFEGGCYPTSPSAFVLIDHIAFTSENIIAKVRGVGAIAEVLVAEAFNVLWESTGTPRRWESKEVQERLHLVGFSTTTKVDLGARAENLLHGQITKYMDENVDGGGGLAAKMSVYSKYDSFKPSPDLVATWTMGEIELEVHVFNRRTGRPEKSRISIRTQTKDETGRGIVLVTSELPYDDHIAFVAELVRLVGETRSSDGG